MDFSVTGNLLPGSIQRPDIVTIVFTQDHKYVHRSSECWQNTLGYIPVVSTVTGLTRALLGLVHTIAHLACSIFTKNRDHHLQEAKLGAKNIGIGLVEAIPFIGNIRMFFVNQERLSKFEIMAEQQMGKKYSAYDHHAVMFIYGKEIAKRPLAEYYSEIGKLKKPTQADIERIICNKV